MAFRIEETFTVQAPPDRVWRYLIDPRQVVECLPGAELTEARDDRTFAGRVKVKVGPVVAAYAGTARLDEVDEDARRVRLTAEGRESGGAGSAKMTMTSTVAPRGDGGSEVRVEAQLEIAGRIVQFGRGMIDTVNKQLFGQFTACVRARFAQPAEGQPAAPLATAPPTTAEGGGPPPPSLSAAGSAAPPLLGSDAPAAPLAPAAHVARPVRVIPLLLHALWERLLALFRRRARG
ncbi:MAG TPA: SRPBCC family protein [Gemmatimonadaceae bacterium]|nr:SRPBCC family protein [Gemmatimonadaceae bacterium]